MISFLFFDIRIICEGFSAIKTISKKRTLRVLSNKIKIIFPTAIAFKKNSVKVQSSKPRPLETGCLPQQIPGNSYTLT